MCSLQQCRQRLTALTGKSVPLYHYHLRKDHLKLDVFAFSGVRTKSLSCCRERENHLIRTKAEYCTAASSPSSSSSSSPSSSSSISSWSTCSSTSPALWLRRSSTTTRPRLLGTTSTSANHSANSSWTNTYVAREPGHEALLLESGVMVKRKLYAVKKGRQPGLYDTWKEAEQQVKGYSDAVHRSFSTREDAESYLRESQHFQANPEEEKEEEEVQTQERNTQERAAEEVVGLTGEDDDDVTDKGKKRKKKKKKKLSKAEKSMEEEEGGGGEESVKVRQSTTRAGEYHIMQFDGGARGNPGIAGAGVVLLSPTGEVLHKKKLFLGDKVTNNQAEYHALIMGLELGLELGYRKLEVEGDSELVIKQVVGHYEVNNEQLKILMKQVEAVLKQMEDIVIRHIPRDQNKIADELANMAMDAKTSDA